MLKMQNKAKQYKLEILIETYLYLWHWYVD